MRLLILLLAILIPSCAWATTSTFQEGVSGYAGTSDATISSASTNEHVTDGTTKIRSTGDGYMYILHFNISTIPTNATVTSATVQLYLDEQNCTNETVGVKQIEDPDSSGAFADNDSAVDEFNANADWLYKNDTTNTKWQTSGTDFSDVDDNANESTVLSGSCPGSVAKSLTVTNMVQSWVTTPATNAGMYFTLADTGTVKVKSKRVATSSERPLLTVNYTTPGASNNDQMFQMF